MIASGTFCNKKQWLNLRANERKPLSDSSLPTRNTNGEQRLTECLGRISIAQHYKMAKSEGRV
jgi:hypothetical protein